MTKTPPENIPTRRKLLAWSVHAITASGVVCGFLAIEASTKAQWRAALLWLFVAVLVDSVDGTLARRVGVKQAVPGFDGTLLDNLVDFLNYVIVPAFILHRADLLWQPLSLPLAMAVCLASTYQFCQTDAKTPDHTFKGFPCYWNVVAMYMLAFHASVLTNTLLLALLVVLVFVPIKYIYPSRALRFRTLTLLLTGIWGLMVTAIIWQLPDASQFLVWGSLLYVVYYVAMSLYLMLTAE